MANHKKKKKWDSRNRCHMCKYWKSSTYPKRKRLGGESFGNSKRRYFADLEKMGHDGEQAKVQRPRV